MEVLFISGWKNFPKTVSGHTNEEKGSTQPKENAITNLSKNWYVVSVCDGGKNKFITFHTKHICRHHIVTEIPHPNTDRY